MCSWSTFHISEGDPNNYVPYYRRATVYLAMGKSKSALPDLDKVIELKPDFIAVSSIFFFFFFFDGRGKFFSFLITSLSWLESLLKTMSCGILPWCNEIFHFCFFAGESAARKREVKTRQIAGGRKGLFRSCKLLFFCQLFEMWQGSWCSRTVALMQCWRSLLLLEKSNLACVIFWQLTRDPANTEALDKSQKIPFLRENLKSAQSALNSGDFQEAIDLLTPAIEVFILFYFILFYFFWRSQLSFVTAIVFPKSFRHKSLCQCVGVSSRLNSARVFVLSFVHGILTCESCEQNAT